MLYQKRKRSLILGISAICAAFFAACGDGGLTGGMLSVDFTGDYTISGRNEPDQCDFPNWDDTGSFEGVSLKMKQKRDTVTMVDTVDATVGGGGGIGLVLALGTNKFMGVGRDNYVSLIAYGKNASTIGTCTYTINATMDLTLSGNVIQGTITYKPSTNGSAECGALATCMNRQKISGTRPLQ